MISDRAHYKGRNYIANNRHLFKLDGDVITIISVHKVTESIDSMNLCTMTEENIGADITFGGCFSRSVNYGDYISISVTDPKEEDLAKMHHPLVDDPKKYTEAAFSVIENYINEEQKKGLSHEA